MPTKKKMHGKNAQPNPVWRGGTSKKKAAKTITLAEAIQDHAEALRALAEALVQVQEKEGEQNQTLLAQILKEIGGLMEGMHPPTPTPHLRSVPPSPPTGTPTLKEGFRAVNVDALSPLTDTGALPPEIAALFDKFCACGHRVAVHFGGTGTCLVLPCPCKEPVEKSATTETQD